MTSEQDVQNPSLQNLLSVLIRVIRGQKVRLPSSGLRKSRIIQGIGPQSSSHVQFITTSMSGWMLWWTGQPFAALSSNLRSG